MIMRVGTLVAALAVTVTPAAAEDFPNSLAESENATLLQPVSPWNIDFGASRCRLTRLFGSEDDQHLLFFEQGAPRQSFGVTFAGSEVKRFQDARRLEIGMERDEPVERQERIGIGEVAQVGPAIIVASYSIGRSDPSSMLRNVGIDLAEAETIDRIVLKRGNRVLSFETGNMMPPFQAMNACTSDLLRDWGLDPDKHQSFAPPKWTNQETIVRRIQNVYPRSALVRGEQAIFRMRVIVEEDGSVSECFIENSTETDRLDSPACRTMERARFEPARDAQGQPMRSFFATSITYAIGG